MQNKGLVKLFALLFGLVSIYQLSFSFKANQIETNAKQFAVEKIQDTETDYDAKRALAQSTYLDSLKNEEVYNIGIAQYNFDEVKEKAMNLGLDLKGGISVILQISVKDILVGLANESKDPVFRKALSDAEELQKDSQNTYLEDFFVAFEAIQGDTKLASPDIFANIGQNREREFIVVLLIYFFMRWCYRKWRNVEVENADTTGYKCMLITLSLVAVFTWDIVGAMHWLLEGFYIT